MSENYISLTTVRSITNIIYAKSNDQTRLILNTIHVDSENIVATDGYRLAMVSHDETFFKNLETPISIKMDNKETIIFLNRVKELKQHDGHFQLKIELNERYFTMLDYVFALEPTFYPKYQQILPSKISMKVGFNRAYLIEALKNIKGKNVQLGLNSDLTPCLITSTDPEQKHFVNVLMPMKL